MSTQQPPDPGARAFFGAARIAGALAFESLRTHGWSSDELLAVLDAIERVNVEPAEGENPASVTLTWDDQVDLPENTVARLEKQLPLVLWALSTRPEAIES